MYEPPETIARGPGVSGELALRRRRTGHAEVFELIINGTFLMDTAETSTERLLAEALLDRHESPGQVLVGGLGLGFTAAALLDDQRVEHVEVVELEPLLAGWLRAGLVPDSAAVLDDPRVTVTLGDVRAVVETSAAGQYDAVLLDVDNGPGFLVRDANAAVYQAPWLRSAARALAPGGILAIWSAAPDAALAATLTDQVGAVISLVRTVQREGRDVDYVIYLARRPSS